MEAADYISRAEAARRLGVSRQRVGQLIKSGRIPAIHVAGHPVVSVADLAAFLSAGPLRPGRPKKRLPT